MCERIKSASCQTPNDQEPYTNSDVACLGHTADQGKAQGAKVKNGPVPVDDTRSREYQRWLRLLMAGSC